MSNETTKRSKNGGTSPRYDVVSGRVRRPATTAVVDPSQQPQTSPWLITIAVVMILGAAFVASSLLVPLAMALVAYLTLRPIVARLGRVGLNRTVASALVIIGFFSAIGLAAALLYDPLQAWLADAPESVNRVRAKFDRLAEPLTMVDRAEDQLNQATLGIGEDAGNITVSVKKPSLVDASYLINTTGHVLVFIAGIAVLAFFMLSSGDDVLNRVLMVLPDQKQRKRLLATISDVQDGVGNYLGKIAMINLGLGLAVTAVMWSVGMPTPFLWGAMATLFNFIPYIGPIAGTVVVFVAAGSAFDSISRSLLISIAFWLTTAVEGQLVTPAILGRSLKVGSLIVLIAVAFWGFLWGLPGIFLSVPLLIIVRHVFASFDATYPLAVVLGESPCRPGEDCQPLEEDQPIADVV